MSILGAKNKVIAGDYSDGKIMLSGGKVVLSISLGNMIVLNKKMVAAHRVESEVKGNHKVFITFADGKKSLLELDDKLCKALLEQLF
ncbi:MAG: hypothetical protein ACOCM4_15320 [Acetivibrio ethanolgignens]